jgi:hypothetical protein
LQQAKEAIEDRGLLLPLGRPVTERWQTVCDKVESKTSIEDLTELLSKMSPDDPRKK